MARALEGVGRLGDISALDGSPDPKNNGERPRYNAIAEYEKAGSSLKVGDDRRRLEARPSFTSARGASDPGKARSR